MSTVPIDRNNLVFCNRFGCNRLHSYVLAVVFSYKNHSTVDKGIQSVILAHTYVYTRVVNRTALTLDDVSGFNALTTENFNSESLAFRRPFLELPTPFLCAISF